MNTNTILIAVIVMLVGGIGGYAFGEWKETSRDDCPFHEGGKGKAESEGMHRMSDGSLMSNTNDDGSRGMNDSGHMMQMMVTSEKSFIEEMIPHHQEAVDTAKEVIERGGTTPAVKTLVENIVVAQEKEIADMKQWYETWYGTAYQDKGTYQPMMRELTTLSGVELDKAFLTDMIMHHMGAIMMARSVGTYIEHDEMKQLTSNILATQSEEITLMRRLLTEI